MKISKFKKEIIILNKQGVKSTMQMTQSRAKVATGIYQTMK